MSKDKLIGTLVTVVILLVGSALGYLVTGQMATSATIILMDKKVDRILLIDSLQMVDIIAIEKDVEKNAAEIKAHAEKESH